jgi:hypothetical protein
MVLAELDSPTLLGAMGIDLVTPGKYKTASAYPVDSTDPKG